MRSRLWLPLLATALSGCASLSDLLVPAPAPPPLRPAVVEDEPAPAAKPAPVAKEPALAQPKPAAPLAKEPPSPP
ncbi:MAG: hypothetical protein ACREKB_15590, partial [Candidatus Rokuibacteriota bacterium]